MIDIIIKILLFPFIIIALIYIFFTLVIELLLVKHYSYFKKNKLKLRDYYYLGILQDPLFHIKNIISKYDLNYSVIELNDKNGVNIIINDNSECEYIYVAMKNAYFDKEKLYFQYQNDEDEAIFVNDFISSIKELEYDFSHSKLIILKEVLSKNDRDRIKDNKNIIVLNKIDKSIFNIN